MTVLPRRYEQDVYEAVSVLMASACPAYLFAVREDYLGRLELYDWSSDSPYDAFTEFLIYLDETIVEAATRRLEELGYA